MNPNKKHRISTEENPIIRRNFTIFQNEADYLAERGKDIGGASAYIRKLIEADMYGPVGNVKIIKQEIDDIERSLSIKKMQLRELEALDEEKEAQEKTIQDKIEKGHKALWGVYEGHHYDPEAIPPKIWQFYRDVTGETIDELRAWLERETFTRTGKMPEDKALTEAQKKDKQERAKETYLKLKAAGKITKAPHKTKWDDDMAPA